MFKIKIWLATILVAVLSKQTVQDPAELLKVSFYFESCCTGCHYYFHERLYPGYQKIASSLSMELVPFTWAKRKVVNNQTIIMCDENQATMDSCYVAKISECGLTKCKNQDKQMAFIDCVEYPFMGCGHVDKKAVAECATHLGLTVSELLECAEGPEGDKLLLEFRDKQIANNNKYVPWIAFNGHHDPKVEEDAMVDFLKTACNLLSNRPDGCPKNEEFYFNQNEI